MTVQTVNVNVKDDSYTQPARRIPRAAVLGIRGARPSTGDDKRLSAKDCELAAHARLDYRPKYVPRETTSYTDEHMRMKPVMDAVRKTRMFEPISAGFRLYCTRKTRPPLTVAGRKYFRSRSLVATVTWKWKHSNERIIGLEVNLAHGTDLAWASKKIESIFKKAGMDMPHITLKE
jgi:hypothetical protein